MNWHRAVSAFTFAIYLGSSAAFGGMVPQIEARGNPAVHKVQKAFLHDSFRPIGRDADRMGGLSADALLKRDQQSPLVPLDQQDTPLGAASKRMLDLRALEAARALDLNRALGENYWRDLLRSPKPTPWILVPSSRSEKALNDEQPQN
jgi:hypothetical protein